MLKFDEKVRNKEAQIWCEKSDTKNVWILRENIKKSCYENSVQKSSNLMLNLWHKNAPILCENSDMKKREFLKRKLKHLAAQIW